MINLSYIDYFINIYPGCQGDFSFLILYGTYPSSIYRHRIRAALSDWAGERIYLALDSSQLWERFTLVRVVLVYRGRALPVSWVVLASPSATVALEDYQVILNEAAAVLPSGWRVILLADRGFFDKKLLIQRCVSQSAHTLIDHSLGLNF